MTMTFHIGQAEADLLFPLRDAAVVRGDEIDYSALLVTKSSVYSISYPAHADLVSRIIRLIFEDPHSRLNKDSLSIIDGMANIGGNTYSFVLHGFIVTAVELGTAEFKALSNNLTVLFGDHNVAINCGNLWNLLPKFAEMRGSAQIADVLFLDPPWGGIDYREGAADSETSLGDSVFADVRPHAAQFTVIIFKLPLGIEMRTLKQFYTSIVVTRMPPVGPERPMYALHIHSGIKLPELAKKICLPYKSYKALPVLAKIADYTSYSAPATPFSM